MPIEKSKLFNAQEDWLPLVLVLLSVMIFLHNGLSPLYTTQVLSSQGTDTRSYFYPSRSYGFTSILKGAMPLWNQYLYSGTPYIASLQTAIFYPLNALFLFLPIGSAINWSIALHLFLSGTFTYYLLKYYGAGRFGSALAGMVYTFSAPQVMHIYAGHLNVLTAMVWTPLMFLFLDRLIKENSWRYGIYLSFTVAIQFLAGQPQYLFYSLIALSLYLLFLLIKLKVDGVEWGEVGLISLLFAVSIILGLALSAIQIFPTMEMTRYSSRENLSYEWVSIFSFPPQNLITFLIPDFFGNMINIPYWGKNYLWEMSAYVGITPLLLAVVAVFYVRERIVWFFAGLAVVSLILALGKYTPLLKLLYNYVPGFNLFRGNSKWIFLNALSLAVLSGFGADFVIREMDAVKKRLRMVIAGLCLVSIAGLLIAYGAFDDAWFRKAVAKVVSSGDLYSNGTPFIQKGFATAACASFRSGILWTIGLLISGTAILLLYSYGKLRENILIVSIFSIITFDLFAFGMRYMVTFDSKEVDWDKEVVSFLRQDREPFRAIAPGMDVNSGMVAGIETLSGYDTIMVKRYSEFINFSQGQSPDISNLWVNIESVNKLTNLLNAKYLVLRSGQEISDPAFKAVFDNGRYRIYQNLNALPRAFIVHRAEVILGRDAIFRKLASPEFDPTASAVVEEELNLFPPSPQPLPVKGEGEALPRVVNHSPNKVTIEAYLAQPGLLVLGDTYYPGWRAFVDGKESRIYPANYIMRSVALPEGKHTVEFRYSPLSFKIGAIISLLSFVLVTGFFVWDLRKKRRSVIP